MTNKIQATHNQHFILHHLALSGSSTKAINDKKFDFTQPDKFAVVSKK